MFEDRYDLYFTSLDREIAHSGLLRREVRYADPLPLPSGELCCFAPFLASDFDPVDTVPMAAFAVGDHGDLAFSVGVYADRDDGSPHPVKVLAVEARLRPDVSVVSWTRLPVTPGTEGHFLEGGVGAFADRTAIAALVADEELTHAFIASRLPYDLHIGEAGSWLQFDAFFGADLMSTWVGLGADGEPASYVVDCEIQRILDEVAALP